MTDEISLIILDVEMPERNGIETARWIRNFEAQKQRKNIPILGLTGHESESVKQECLNSGMNRVLSKPIKRTDALNIIKEYI